MRRIKFALINPTAPLWQVHRDEAPRGPKTFRFSMLPSLYVAAAMPPFVETRIIDEDIEPVDYDVDADLIGLSFMTFNAPRAYDIADRFRQEKGKPVIVGGYHPTFMPDEAIKHADAVCVGEAENNVPQMVADFVNGKLQPFYENGLADLKGLSIPDRGLIKRSAYITPNAIQATRGCPYHCKFCSVTAFSKHQFRARPVEEVIAELQTLNRYVIFMDDNIIGDTDYAKTLFAAMRPLKKEWFSQCSLRIAYDDELLRLAKESGCRGMFIGLESLSQDNLNAWHKGFNRAKDYTRAIQKIHAVGIGVFAGLVFGMDWDTPEVFRRTLEFLNEAKVDALQATNLTPFPGTPLFDEMEKAGRILHKDWSKYNFAHVVFSPKEMSPETLKRGTDWVLLQFYSRQAVWRRIRRAFGYLSPSIILRALAPLNLGYRRRLAACGTFANGQLFTP